MAFYAPINKWVQGDDIISYCAYGANVISNPEAFRRQSDHFDQIKKHHRLPSGTYAITTDCPYWMQTNPEKMVMPERSQGLKLHVSAKPQTALKIAKIALPILHEMGVDFNVMYDLRFMRDLYYLSHYRVKNYIIGQGYSTQAGKFIAIFPQNLQQAQNIILAIESSFQSNQLNPNYFVRLKGDAQVGDTGGIFARYGKFKPTPYKGRQPANITSADPLNESILPELMHQQNFLYNPETGLVDERIYPWPDYMNNRILFNEPLFGALKVTWVNPNNLKHVVTWENRPNCWAELEGKLCS